MSGNAPSQNPLSYAGVLPNNPTNLIRNNRPPQVTDINANIGDEWEDTSVTPSDFYKLANLYFNRATWILLAPGTGFLESLSDTANTPVFPSSDVSVPPNNVQLVGAVGQINVVSNPSSHSITFSLAGGGEAIDSIQVDNFTAPGTNPVVSNSAGLITVTGAQVASGIIGTNVIRTNSLAANTYNIEIQRSTASAISTLADNGVSHFNNTQFTVDGNGFVQLVGGGPYISLSPYIVGQPGDVHAGYTTIQAAITQAVADGASSSNPLNIYVKPGTYTENLTVFDGIHVIAFGADFSPGNTTGTGGTSVFLIGTVTQTSGNVLFSGIDFSLTSGNIFNFSSGSLNLIACNSAHSSNSLFVLTTANAKNINLQNCVFFGSSTATLISTDNSSMSIVLLTANNSIQYNSTQTTITGAGASITIAHEYDHHVVSWIFNCGSYGYDTRYSSISAASGFPLLTNGANVSAATVSFFNSELQPQSSVFFDFSLGSGVNWEIVNSSIISRTSTDFSITEPANITRLAHSFVKEVSLTSQSAQQIFSTNISGWRGSEYIQKQAMLQTTSGSVQTLITIPVAAGTAIALQGIISATNTGHTDITGGNFLVIADGTSATIIGTPVLNIISSTTGTFSATFSGGNLIIQVTAPSASAYNWVSTYQYQQVINNT